MRRALALLLIGFALPVQGMAQTCTPVQMRAQLARLKTVVEACAAQNTSHNCDPALVGQDATVMLPDGQRRVEFDWLRGALADAGQHPKKANALRAAEARLNLEEAELAAPAVVPSAQLKQEQDKLQRILVNGEFAQAQPPSLEQQLLAAFMGWLSRRLAGLSGSGSNTRWIGQFLIGVVALLACGGLLLWFSRVQRRQRVMWQLQRAARDGSGASLPDWQQWRDEAQQLAAQQRWREGIHRLYWAAIAQLESRGVWRHDAARTPREYLELLPPQSETRRELQQLTRSLESFWYGNRPAESQDYAQALVLLESLVRA